MDLDGWEGENIWNLHLNRLAWDGSFQEVTLRRYFGARF